MTLTIEAANLVKRFGKTRALDGLDLVAEPGQVVAVLGPTAPARPHSCGRCRHSCARTPERFGWRDTMCAGTRRRSAA
jgi:ABC-type histidine transport system ATPase subunit